MHADRALSGELTAFANLIRGLLAHVPLFDRYTPHERLLLQVLQTTGVPISSAVLARRIGVGPPRLSTLIHRLRDCVDVLVDSSDRRRSLYQLNSVGGQYLQEVEAAEAIARWTYLKALSGAERRIYRRLLKKMHDALVASIATGEALAAVNGAMEGGKRGQRARRPTAPSPPISKSTGSETA